MTNFVYYIASHKNPEQIIRLIRMLREGSPDSRIVVHHDFSKTQLDASTCERLGAHVLPYSAPGKWGTFSLVEMTLRTLNWLNENIQFDWLVFLSGQDYPIRPLEDIENSLAASGYDAFMRAAAIEDNVPCGGSECPVSYDGKRCWDCDTRYYYRYYSLPLANLSKWVPKQIRDAMRSLGERVAGTNGRIVFRDCPPTSQRLLGIRGSHPFNGSFRCFKGSMWFSVNRKAVSALCRKRTALESYYRRTLIPDESYFQTILYNDPTVSICRDDKRFMIWRDRTSFSPEVLTRAHIGQLEASDKHFARKFDATVDSTVLDLLDRRVLHGWGKEVARAAAQ